MPPPITRVPNQTLSDVPPVAPLEGDLWWNINTGQEFIYYDDGNTAQWVIANRGPPGPQGPPGNSTGAAAGVLAGEYPSPGFAPNPVFNGSVTLDWAGSGMVNPVFIGPDPDDPHYAQLTLNGKRNYLEMAGFEVDVTGADPYFYINAPPGGGFSFSVEGSSLLDINFALQYAHFLFDVTAPTLKTSAPGGGSGSGVWQLGQVVAGPVAHDTTRSLFVTIDGLLCRILLAEPT